jgi:hypothetical protein
VELEWGAALVLLESRGDVKARVPSARAYTEDRRPETGDWRLETVYDTFSGWMIFHFSTPLRGTNFCARPL